MFKSFFASICKWLEVMSEIIKLSHLCNNLHFGFYDSPINNESIKCPNFVWGELSGKRFGPDPEVFRGYFWLYSQK